MILAVHVRPVLELSLKRAMLAARWALYRAADRLFRPLDLERLRQLTHLRLLPPAAHRYGGHTALVEWAATVGAFGALVSAHRPATRDLRLLDVGCGTGKLAIAAEAVLGPGGRYTGIDVRSEDIAFCRRHYPAPRFEFYDLPARNALYRPDGEAALPAWPLPDRAVDVITAVSVWTHLQEGDAKFYFVEIGRVLRPGGVALITFFLLDERYIRVVAAGTAGRFLFDRSCTGSGEWRYPSWASVPEQQIGLTPKALLVLADTASLSLERTYQGSWKDEPGPYFQDVVVLRRPG